MAVFYSVTIKLVAGHNVRHDRPDIVNPAIINFLGGDR